MKEFIDKLIERLEEERKKVNRDNKNKFCPTTDLICKESAFIQAISIVNQLAEEYKVSEIPTGWISVSDRLPSKANHNVLVTYKDRYIGGVYGVCEGQYVHSLKEWQITDYAIDDDFNVIAWCEKPAPYTEGE